MYGVTTGGLDAKDVITVDLGRFDVARRIARQSRHHTRVDEGFTVALVNLIGGSVEVSLEIGRIFDATGVGVFYGNARHRPVTAIVCDRVVVIDRQIRSRIDLGKDGEVRRDFRIGVLIAHRQLVFAGE